ncbi:FAD-dependent oxidoreductase [Reticulibacter mediterranei]|uniref:FAD-dependent oxidoreductase n=1 Tax=Reticulibacter mediterranei TaxID=2778369 RepID=A0A8J3IYG6_9CHLR|nr:NAD(P)/FAD-dependent oxidoreductase [Reticulibacter mediterranei]GHO97536.1 FAD-dependent oxidoreductase [Reticulibacter mediterranei]
MVTHHKYDAIVIGAGPNGLAAAIALAQAGRSVVVFEAKETIGGGSRSLELTLPGFVHDLCSAIHPLAFNSPFLRTLPLAHYGLEWIHPPVPLAHPLDDGSAVLLERSLDTTGDTLESDGANYHRLMAPLVARWSLIEQAFLGPLRVSPLLRHPFALGRFGLLALRSAQGLARQRFTGERARALFAGISAHSMLSLDQPSSAAAGIVLGVIGHVVGWPFPRGGSQKIVDALAAYFQALGGEIVTGVEVKTLASLPPARALLFDVTPRQLLRIAGDHLSYGYSRALQRYRYGPGVFKIDYALDSPIPWKAESCLRAASVHLGGTLSEIAAAEYQVTHNQHPEKPFVLLAQQSLFDETRTPTGKHTAWAYCHVPHGSTFDMTERIEAQIERFAPGFRNRILARHSSDSAAMERYNANYIGGDISGGVQDIWQLFTRPAIRPVPYTTSAKHIFLCSSSTPPGGGVHGMCGYFAAQTALRSVLR